MYKTLLFLFIALLVSAAAVNAEDEISRQIESEYPAKSYLVGIGRKERSNNLMADRRVAEVLARSEIAKQIRVRVKEETIDIMCESSTGRLFNDKENCMNEFSMVIEVTVDEFLEGTRIVRHGEKDGMVYSVAVMPRADAAESLKNNVRDHIKNAKESMDKARQGDSGSIDKAQDEYMKAVASEREREVIEGIKGRSSELLDEMEKEITELKEKGELK